MKCARCSPSVSLQNAAVRGGAWHGLTATKLVYPFPCCQFGNDPESYVTVFFFLGIHSITTTFISIGLSVSMSLAQSLSD